MKTYLEIKTRRIIQITDPVEGYIIQDVYCFGKVIGFVFEEELKSDIDSGRLILATELSRLLFGSYDEGESE